MLSSGELSALRTTLNASLPESGTISRLTLANDGMGGGTPSWAAIGTADCRVAPQGQRSADGAIIADRIGEVSYWLVTFPNATAVTAADRITSGGRTFEIVGVRAPHSWELSRRLVCVEVT